MIIVMIKRRQRKMKRGKKPSMAGIRIEIYECWSRI